MMDERSLDGWLERLGDLRVAVVGDVMLDRFVFGRVDRISPEAPVPVVHVQGEEERLGGAANVAANVRALGCRARLHGVLGSGEASQALVRSLEGRGIDASGLVHCDHRMTTVKTRILGGGQQIVRIDRETKAPLRDETHQRLVEVLERTADVDVVVVSDYGKGVVGPPLMQLMRAWHDRGTPVVVDPKQGNFDLYRGTTCITPNAREAGAASHDTVEGDDDAVRVGRALRERLGTDLVLLTRGEDGMTVVEQSAVTHLATEATHVFDVTGAGDTVIATFGALLGAGAPAVDAARVANLAAGIVIRELGTAVVDPSELRRAWRRRGQVGEGAR